MMTPTPKRALQLTDAVRERVRHDLAHGGDSTNPTFTFSCTSTAVLLVIADGQINLLDLVLDELINRGVSLETGEWVGFNRAREIPLGGHARDDIAAPTDEAEAAATEIAKRILRIETLDAVNSDRQDFHEVACWQIKEALAAAFAAGQAAAK